MIQLTSTPASSRLRLLLCLLFAVAMMLLPVRQEASAHAYSASYTTLTLSKSGIQMVYAIDELSVIEWAGGDANDNKMLEPEEFETVKSPFAEIMKKHLLLKSNGELLQWAQIESEVLDREGDASKVILTVRYPAPSSSGAISLMDDLYKEDSKTNYVNLLTIHAGDSQSTAALSGSNRTWAMQLTDDAYASLPADLNKQPEEASSSDAEEVPNPGTIHSSNALSGWFSFFKLGMNHILGGYDHLLFLFSLLIARQTFKQYAAMITAFTIAHSITLTLSVLGWIHVPGAIVEPMIALSICYVAIDNMLRPQVSYRWVLTFLFGLIHGMGFADILMEMNLPRADLGVDLVSFNLGIETVQLALVSLFVPLLYAMHRYKHSRKLVFGGSGVALLLGGIWLIERVFVG